MLDLAATQKFSRVLSDASRLRLVSLLLEAELTVAELTEILGASQSRVSTHLGRLREVDLVRVRREGALAYYGIDREALSPGAARFLALVEATRDDPLLLADAKKAKEIVRRRTRAWPDSVAGQMERHYSPGRTWEASAHGILGLAELGDVLDVASGDGVSAELLARRARTVTCIDISERVVEAGRARLAHLPNVKLVVGDMHALPFADRSFDQVLLMNALSYTTDAARVLGEAARVTRPGGRISAIALRRHAHEDKVLAFGHQNLGYEPAELAQLFSAVDCEVELATVTTRERRPPHFEVITVYASRRAKGRPKKDPKS